MRYTYRVYLTAALQDRDLAVASPPKQRRLLRWTALNSMLVPTFLGIEYKLRMPYVPTRGPARTISPCVMAQD